MLRGGERLDPFVVAYTPGHASHHVSYWHEPTRTAFVGDVAGVRIAPDDYVLAPTPPPDIDLEAWADSLALLRAWQPEQLAITHFGLFDDAAAHLDGIERSLAVAAERARELDARGVRRGRRAPTSPPPARATPTRRTRSAPRPSRSSPVCSATGPSARSPR